jgi:hypothetical protein
LFAESENKKGDRDYFLPVNPDQQREERQEDNNSVAPNEHLLSPAVRRSSALTQPLPEMQKEPRGLILPSVRAKPENSPELLDRSRRALRPEQTRGSPQERP